MSWGGPYTKDEEDIIARHHPDMEKIGRLLPHRTKCGLGDKARALGLSIKKNRDWDADRMELLRHLSGKISDREAGKILGVSSGAISRQRYRNDLPGLPTTKAARAKIALVQDILDHVHAKKIALWPISRRFSKRKLTPGIDRHFSYPVAAKVVDALGGELYAEWDE